jgi:protein-disulfide isomerase
MRDFDAAAVQQVGLDAPRKGEAAAPIKVVEYSDMMCPYCRNLAGAFRDYVPQTAGRVAVYFKHYPLDQSCNAGLPRTIHPGACSLALGGVCAEQQGRFWEYHDRVFAQALEKASEADARRFAQEAGLDLQRFGACLTGGVPCVPSLACLASPQAQKRLEADLVEARGLGVAATPTLLINGRKVPNLNLFLQLVDKEAQRLGLPPLPPPQAAAR